MVRKRKLLAAAVAAALVPVAMAGSVPSAQASSHREAPLISQDPVADNTDSYMFRDPVDQSKVDIVANYIGLEQPASGPRFVRFGDDVLYEIHIDNDGDARDDITYQFRFRTKLTNPDTGLYNTGPIDPATLANASERQTYSVRRIKHGDSKRIAEDVPTPPNNIGPRSTPNYTSFVTNAIKDLPDGGKVFAGQRDDAFYFDLGSGFDLLGLRPINGAHAIPLAADAGRDGLAGKNVHAIVLQLPIDEVTKNHDVPTTVDSKDSVIGMYASSSRQKTRVLSDDGDKPRNRGDYVQVSRLGLPLVNELLIPVGQRDEWNATEPEDDHRFFDDILDPEPTKLLPAVYPSVFHAPGTAGANLPAGGMANRPDLIKLLTGQLNGLSAANALPPADLLRLNLAVPAVQGTLGNRLGALAGDPAGFPNGRRLTDDIIDITLRVVAAGELLDDGDGVINNSGGTPFAALSDGVDQSGIPQLSTFPFEGTPLSGYDQSPTG